MRARPILFVLVALAFAAPLRAADDALAIVDRAIKAIGGESALNRARACEMKMEGAVYSSEGKLPFRAVALSQLPDQFKHIMEYDRGGRRTTQVQVYNGNNVYIRIDTNVVNLDNDLKAALLKGRFADNLTNLTVLKSKDYQLASLGESKVEGKAVLGVKVTAPERPTVQMFFDKETGLLVKTEHRQLDPRNRDGQEVIQEVFYSDYQVLDTTAADEKIVKAAGVGTDAAGLLDFFKKRGGSDDKQAKIRDLIAQLGDDAFDKREQATTQLIAFGADAVPQLKAALKNADLEVVRRAEECLKKIGNVAGGKREDPQLPSAAARLLAARKPAGAAEALLNFLPSAPDETSSREVRAALALVALVDGKPDKSLLDALDSKDPVKRGAAAEALGRVPLPTGRKILVEGLKRPTKIAVYRAGRKFMEWQLTEISYFNKLEDKPFTTP